MRFIHIVVICSVINCFLNANVAWCEENFEAWLQQFHQEALAQGISNETLQTSIQVIELLPEVIRLDRSQPEFVTPFIDYYHQRVNQSKVKRGIEKLEQHAPLLVELEKKYGVSPAYLIAFWGMETNYGQDQGNVNTLSSLATLAYEGRRAQFFRSQLLDALRMIDQLHLNPSQLKGSWAGAFGHMQFMPSTFLTYAIDGDGDLYPDLLHSEADALASAANYLSQVGWREHGKSMIEVQLPDNFMFENAQLNLRKTVLEWSQIGVQAITAQAAEKVKNQRMQVRHQISKRMTQHHKKYSSKRVEVKNQPHRIIVLPLNAVIQDTTQLSAILLPQGWRGPALMVFDNFDAIMDWNRSVNYALSVAQLAQRIQQSPAILGGEQAEAGALSFIQMIQLQTTLNDLGFNAGEVDGLPGLQTQVAIRMYQIKQHLPADGYASPSIFNLLIQSAGKNQP